LLDGSGSDVAGPCAGFGTSAPNFPCGPLAASGSPYRVEVEAAHPGDTGAYAVRFERLTAAQACEDTPLTCAVPVNGTIDGPLDTDLFSFSVGDGEMVEITVVSGTLPGAIIDAAWQLIDGAGSPVDGLCGLFDVSDPNFVCGPLAVSGNPYRIKVGDHNAAKSGQFRVRFQRLTAAAVCSSTALTCGIPLTTAITDPLETKLFSFSINEGDTVGVTVEKTPPFAPGFDAGWRLLDRTGQPVGENCANFYPSLPNFECGPLPAAGNPYQLEIRGAGDPVTGNARVLLHALTTPCATECPGDCDGSQDVSIRELVTMVNIALFRDTFLACSPGDANHDGRIKIDELVTAVNKALKGCGGS
jgi:hypothetical protein